MLLADGEAQLKRTSMLLYPYIQDCTISHGRDAEILRVHKVELFLVKNM